MFIQQGIVYYDKKKEHVFLVFFHIVDTFNN